MSLSNEDCTPCTLYEVLCLSNKHCATITGKGPHPMYSHELYVGDMVLDPCCMHMTRHHLMHVAESISLLSLSFVFLTLKREHLFETLVFLSCLIKILIV